MQIKSSPWEYLRNFGVTGDADTTAFFASGYKLLQWIGIFGCAITMIIAIIRFTSSNSNVRADAKSLFTKKIVMLFFIFTAAYCFGYIWGLFATL